MPLDEFISQLADGDSNDNEIDYLQAALREAVDRLDTDSLQEFEARLPAILAGM
jgi:uncharacterized protein (DUF2267 family)